MWHLSKHCNAGRGHTYTHLLEGAWHTLSRWKQEHATLHSGGFFQACGIEILSHTLGQGNVCIHTDSFESFSVCSGNQSSHQVIYMEMPVVIETVYLCCVSMGFFFFFFLHCIPQQTVRAELQKMKTDNDLLKTTALITANGLAVLSYLITFRFYSKLCSLLNEHHLLLVRLEPLILW